MNIISTNVANAQTTRTEEGGLFRRKIAVRDRREVLRFFTNLLRSRKRAKRSLSKEKGRSDLWLSMIPKYPDG
jgi:flagellar basal body rod protein FlgC